MASPLVGRYVSPEGSFALEGGNPSPDPRQFRHRSLFPPIAPHGGFATGEPVVHSPNPGSFATGRKSHRSRPKALRHGRAAVRVLPQPGRAAVRPQHRHGSALLPVTPLGAVGDFATAGSVPHSPHPRAAPSRVGSSTVSPQGSSRVRHGLAAI